MNPTSFPELFKTSRDLRNLQKSKFLGSKMSEKLEKHIFHDFWSRIRDSSHSQWSIYRVGHEESDFQVRNEQFWRLEVKN